MKIFTEYEYRNGNKYMFMSLYSAAMQVMKTRTGLTESRCQVLLHVHSFKYFKKIAIQKTSFFKNLNVVLKDLSEKGYIRIIVKPTENTQTIYSITLKGEYECDMFYRNLLTVGKQIEGI